ncbi:MAG TPA: 4Fe-4S binding protein [Acidobacteriota bacterium]|nr:4Fe-4S binding protein [Acidobacteriota bacterium]
MRIPPTIHSSFVKIGETLARGGCVLLGLLVAPIALVAQYQKKPPDFGGTHSFPTPVHPEPAATWLRDLDVGLLAIALAVAAFLVYKRRSRKGVTLLSIASVAYFGFYRKGCICSVGAIQNVVLCLVDSRYFVSLSVLAIFFLPLLATLFFGRIFCSGVCPLGAIQDLVVVKPLKVPMRLDRALRYLQFVYLGLAVLFAGWGLQLHLGSKQLKLAPHFIICDWDPFISIFRRAGPFHLVALGAAFIAAGMFIGRPYCRWLCPYGGLLSILSRVSWMNVRISPDKELNCGLCAGACPFEAIRELRADRAFCVACARCYEYCPRHKRFVALRDGPKKPVQVKMPPRRWEAIARTWAGILAGLIVLVSAAWLLAVFVHARHVAQTDITYANQLREKATSDAEIQKILQPELDRQHNAAVTRRRAYNFAGTALMLSFALWITWFMLFRPKQGGGAGVPARLLKILEEPPKQRPKIPRKRMDDTNAIS